MSLRASVRSHKAPTILAASATLMKATFGAEQRRFTEGRNISKGLKLWGFQFDYVRSKPLVPLAKFLLEKDVGLEKMIIEAELRESYRGVPINPHDLIQLQKECRKSFQKS